MVQSELNKEENPDQIMGPYGEYITLETLPKPDTVRWVTRRKAELVIAIKGGLLPLEEALEKYKLSIEELEGWEKTIEKHGLQGLCTTKLKEYR